MAKKKVEEVQEVSQLEAAQRTSTGNLNFTQDQLAQYLERFPENQKDTVYAYLIQSRILGSVLDTMEGKAVLNDLITLIWNSQLELIDTALQVGRGDADAISRVISICQNINCYRNIMERWADTLLHGNKLAEDIR